MPEGDIATLKQEICAGEHVESVVWYDDLADISVPMEILPEKIYREFNTDSCTMMAVFFDTMTSADETMGAIRQIRALVGKQCFVTDLKDPCEKEEPIYVGWQCCARAWQCCCWTAILRR